MGLANFRSCIALLFVASVCVLSRGIDAQAPAPFLKYDFDDGKLIDFLNPTGAEAINFCGQTLPAGTAAVDAGEVVVTNDDVLGLASFALLPDVVAATFPASSRNYALRVKVNLVSANELLIYVRGRLGFIEGTDQIDSQYERGYAFGIIPQGFNADLPDGLVALVEFTACHQVAPHADWPGATAANAFAVADPGIVISPDSWYWVEMTTEGNDDKGPVRITGKIWEDGAEPPATPQIVATDANGIDHNPLTLAPEADTEVFFGTGFTNQQPGAVAKVDDLSLTEIIGCDVPPVKTRRNLWEPGTLAEGNQVALFESGTEYNVSIDLSDVRPGGGGPCTAPTTIRIAETAPAGWKASAPSNGGIAVGGRVTWNLDVAQATGTLTYKVKAGVGNRVTFVGDVSEPSGARKFTVDGENTAVSLDALPQISDFGSIQHWLILGPFTRAVGGAGPGDEEIVKDYLADGNVTQTDIQPKAGDTIEPDYGGIAASTGLAANALGRNPDDIPTWIEWRDYDDADDRIDFEAVYGDIDEVLCHALTYLDVSDEVVVNFGVSSDDSVHVLLDGEDILHHNAARGALGRQYQDTPAAFPSLGNVTLTNGVHTLLVKVFEGGGEHNFRVGFLDDSGVEIPGGPPEVTIRLDPPTGPPPAQLRRGDGDADGDLNITDAIFVLNFLFSGGRAPSCPDAADTDDNGKIEITDPIRTLGFLFLGGGDPPPPGITCGVDPTGADLEACTYDC